MFWHSSAHIMGEAMERHYGGLLCYGPPIEEGFYYDMFLNERLFTSPFVNQSLLVPYTTHFFWVLHLFILGNLRCYHDYVQNEIIKK